MCTSVGEISFLSRTERSKYYKHGPEAKNKPDKYFSIIIVSMDQAKHYLPYFNTNTKVWYTVPDNQNIPFVFIRADLFVTCTA